MDTERFLKDKRCIIQIQNKDDTCCATAIVTTKVKIDEHEQWNYIRQSRRIQEELALELHAKAGVPLHQCGIEDVKTFQRFLVGYQIHVISTDHFNVHDMDNRFTPRRNASAIQLVLQHLPQKAREILTV